MCNQFYYSSQHKTLCTVGGFPLLERVEKLSKMNYTGLTCHQEVTLLYSPVREVCVCMCVVFWKESFLSPLRSPPIQAFYELPSLT